MKILVLSLTFSPDNVSTAQIWAGIAGDAAAAGHDVRVLSTTPHFHRDPGMEAEQPIRNWLWRFVRRSEYRGIPVYHVWMPNKSVWPPLRMLSWVWFHAAATLLGWFMRFRPDVVVAPSPPLTIGVNAWAIAAVRRAKFVYNVQEIYPDIAVNLGVMKNRALIGFFSRMERFIYRKAAAVTSITPSMCAKIASRTAPEKVRLVPNFVEMPDSPPPERDNPLAREFSLRGRFVVAYAGNMGVPQRLGALVELARAEPGLTVLFAGGGGDEKRIRESAAGLPNVVFAGYQPISRMPEIYAACDIFYVGQDPQAGADGIPSKIYRILGNGKPLAVLADPGSDLARFAAESGGGVLLDGNPAVAAEQIRSLMREPARLAALAEAGRAHVSRSFSRSAVSRTYIDLFEESARPAPAEKGKAGDGVRC